MMYKINSSPPQALVIHCSDPRFQRAFREFITDELGISNYIPIVIGGGVHAMVMKTHLPENFENLWEQIDFFLKETKLKQVIIINRLHSN